MFKAKDGSRFTNHSTFKQHEMRLGSKAAAAKPAGPMAGGGDEQDPSDGIDEGQGQDGAAMAAEHGPAVEVTVHHDHEAGKHTVHASHPDGHEHESEHASADEAHKFASECAGCGGGAEGDVGGGDDAGMGMGGA